MAELLQEYLTNVTGPDDTVYVVRSYGAQRPDGTWTGWLEFQPTNPSKLSLRIDQETSQPNRTQDWSRFTLRAPLNGRA